MSSEQFWKHGDRFVEDHMAKDYDYVYNRTLFAKSMYKDFSKEIAKIIASNRLKHPETNKKILELGCGTGIISFLLSDYDKIYNIQRYCLDFSINMLDIAKKRCSSCIQSDIESIPFKKSTFDIIYIHSVIHHFPSFKYIIEEVKRTLKPEGLLIIQEPPASNIKKDFLLRSLAFFFRKIGIKQYEDVSHLELKPSDHHAPISYEILINQMTESGFIIEKMKLRYYASRIFSGFDNSMVYNVGRLLDEYYVRKYKEGYMLLIIGRNNKKNK